MKTDKKFFDAVRPIFGGRLTQGQVTGMIKIVEYANEWGYSVPATSYNLATAKLESAAWMVPVREGARKYGPDYSDASAKRAVASLYRRKIISHNYALPTGPYGQSYYGRGLTQITLYDNYRKFDRILNLNGELLKNPDLALEWQHSLDIMFIGLRDGVFRGKRLKDFDLRNRTEAYLAREIVNGDKHRTYGHKVNVGTRVADDHFVFMEALS